jgi:hypothetical protein
MSEKVSPSDAGAVTGIEDMQRAQLRFELDRGARFVMYSYCISIIYTSFRRSSKIYFIPAGQGSVAKGVGYSLVSFLLGWWGIPWGPIYTIGSIVNNSKGGIDVTEMVIAALEGRPSVGMAPPQEQAG